VQEVPTAGDAATKAEDTTARVVENTTDNVEGTLSSGAAQVDGAADEPSKTTEPAADSADTDASVTSISPMNADTDDLRRKPGKAHNLVSRLKCHLGGLCTKSDAAVDCKAGSTEGDCKAAEAGCSTTATECKGATAGCSGTAAECKAATSAPEA
jgi:hypothetical protein